jgi:hypothetical protein
VLWGAAGDAESLRFVPGGRALRYLRQNRGVPLQIAFQPIPPLSEFVLSTRELVEKGVLIQRELIAPNAFESRARERGIGLDRALLEAWDRDGVLSPLAFSPGPWMSWRTVDPYPTDGIVFRDELKFRPWDEYAFEQHRHPVINALYSEWQLLYLGLARAGDTLEVPLETFGLGPDGLATFATNHQPFVDAHLAYRQSLHQQWLATIRLLLRLQARYWPFVHGQSVILWDGQDQVDALDLEYDGVDVEQLRAELALEPDVLEASYRFLAERAKSLDPLSGLHDIRRFEARRDRERDRGPVRNALDCYDAAEMLRRAYRELTGELLPDADQIRDPDLTPRLIGRHPDQLRQALRKHQLYPHRLHMVVEGETEVSLVKRLFEAFSGRSWDGAGLLITDLGGDKLKGSRTMLEGFAEYADAVALLLDDENDAKRVTSRFSQDGVIRDEHIKLWDLSLEEDNFSPQELLDFVAEIGLESAAVLTLETEDLLTAQESRNQGNGPRKGLASVLQELARQPAHGAVTFSKPQLADKMADRLLREIADVPGAHDEVAERRPIVDWVLRYPLRSFRESSR